MRMYAGTYNMLRSPTRTLVRQLGSPFRGGVTAFQARHTFARPVQPSVLECGIGVAAWEL